MSERAPDLLDRLWAAFGAAVTAPVRGRLGRADAVGLGLLLALGGAMAVAPALYVEDTPLDQFIALDGALRWAHGQRPHVDFYTPVGALWYAALGAAWALTDGEPRLALQVNLLVAPLVALGAWVATRDRLPDLPRVLLAVALTTVALSPRTLDSWLVGGTATYNRWGWAIASVAIAAVLLPPVTRRPRWPEALVVAAALLALFFLKVTYVGLVLGALLVAVLAVPATRGTALAGGALGLALIGSTLPLASTCAYLADVRRAADAAGGEGLLRFDRLADLLSANRTALVLTLALGLALARTSRGRDEERAAGRVVLAAVLVAAGAVGIAIQSHDHTVPALALPLAALYAAWHAREAARPGLGARLAGLALCGVLAAEVAVDAQAVARFAMPHPRSLPLVDHDGPGRAIRAPWADRSAGRVELVLRGEISGFGFDNLAGAAWQIDDDVILRDALDLLRRHGLEDRRIASLTFSPPFPYLLGSPPPRHLPAWWDWKRTFGPGDAERMARDLSDSEVVLVPKVWQIQGIRDVTRPALESAFAVRDETRLWTLWVRR